jgi:hypothetical protein
MIGNPIALIQIPSQRLFSLSAAAQYVGKSKWTLQKYADLGKIEARVEFDLNGRKRRVFTLEALDAYIESLGPWYDSRNGEESGAEQEATNGNL